MPLNPDKIIHCSLTGLLGLDVIRCSECKKLIDCWGEETQLPEPDNEKGIEDLIAAVKKGIEVSYELF